MKISFILPAYKVSDSIKVALYSICNAVLPEALETEIIVVDDGSPDRAALDAVLSSFPRVIVVRHEANKGMCAARNTGIRASTGTVVTILDADDKLHHDWPARLSLVLGEWPQEYGVCYSACENSVGEPTVSEPAYRGPITFDDMLLERHVGEYLPLFRGEYIRQHLYTDLGTRKSCGVLTYLRLAAHRPFWCTPIILRIYTHRRAGSVTSAWANPAKAAESARCMASVMEAFGKEYRERAPSNYSKLGIRLAIYRRLAGMPGAWQAWLRAFSFRNFAESVVALVTLVFGTTFTVWLVDQGKRIGWVKRYG